VPWWLLDYRIWLVAALAAVSLYAASQKIAKEHVQAELAQFRADVESEAAKAKVAAAQQEALQAKHSEEVVSDLQNRLDAANARYARLRASSGSSTVPALSTAAPSLSACPGNSGESDANARFLAQVEERVIAITEAGDREIAKYRELWELQQKNSLRPL